MQETEKEHRAEEVWRTYMTTGNMPDFSGAPWHRVHSLRPIVKRLPDEPRCRLCHYPFEGVGGWLVRNLFGVTESRMNPQICNQCEIAAQRYQGGTEIEMSLLFADVRGSTEIAETMSSVEFSRLINRFYQAATHELYRKNGMVEKLIGDEVTGFFVPGIAGEDHARAAIEAGEAILRATGHAGPEGPWVPVGVGVHTGRAFVGAVGGSEGAADIAVLGDTVNVAARIASQAGTGELLISETAARIVQREVEGLEARRLALKGKQEPVSVWVRKIGEGMQRAPGP